MPIVIRRLLSLAIATIPAIAPLPAQRSTRSEGFVSTPDSARLFYRVIGTARDTIIALHGGPGVDLESIYGDFLPLARKHTVIFYDQRGAGRSTLPRDNVTLTAAQQVRDLDAVRAHFKLAHVSLVAHSYGPLLAATYAIAHPDVVRRMVFFGPVPPRRGEFWQRFARSMGTKLDSMQRAALSDANRRLGDTTLADVAIRQACADYWAIAMRPRLAEPDHVPSIIHANLCASDVRGIRYGLTRTNGAVMNSYGDWDLRAQLTSVPAPTLVVHGEEESIPMDLVEEWVTALPHATLLRVPRAAHFTYAERPDLVWPAVEHFLAPAATEGQAYVVPDPTPATRKHLVARRATGRITLDGRLDESDWLRADVGRDFSQTRPNYVPTTQYPTEVRVLYDEDNLYFGGFNRDSAGLSTLHLPDLRRDFEPPEADDFAITLGPIGDGRTAYQFHISPLGSQGDVQAFDGGDAFNFNWDAMWRVRTSRADSGWVAEIAIPWRSLRYARGLTAWDMNFVRSTRRAGQFSAWMAYPRQLTSWRLTYAGVLDSIHPPLPRTNVRIRPYALGSARRDRTPGANNSPTADIGGEIIWAPTANTLLEATVNTDFAQADVDRQVVNLTRFSVFFPERRQFFLENADLLNAGGLGATSRFIMQPFFTRRIGLGNDGTLLPIDGGARFAYRTGRTTAGVLAMRQHGNGGTEDATFAVARGSQFFGKATRVGATVAVRDGVTAAGDNVVTAVDALARIGEQIQLTGTVSTSTRDNRTALASTWQLTRTTPRSTALLIGAWVTERYDPLTGFVSRANVFVTNPSVNVTFQPTWLPKSVVWFKPGIATYLYHSPQSYALQEGLTQLRGEILYRNGAQLVPFVESNQQRPTAAVTLFPGVSIAAGSRDYTRYGLEAKSDQSAHVSTTANLSTGTFFDGRLDRAAVGARFSPSPYLTLRADYEVNRLTNLGTRDTSFVTHLVAPEMRVFLNPRVQWSAFYQYNTLQQRGALNARFSWEFAPLSFLYIVYNDRQAIQTGTTPSARSVIVKLSWLRQL